MVYLFGIIGFLGGFSIGVFLIHFFLKNKPKSELMQNKSLRWTYGLAVWVCAGLGVWAAVNAYHHYFS